MAVLFTDIETYRHFFYLAFKREEDGVRVGYEVSTRRNELDPARIRKILRKNQIVTFNGLSFDIPLIYLMLKLLEQGVPHTQAVSMVKNKADAIINSRVRHWEVESLLDIRIPKIDHIDLIEPQPNAIASLKTLNGRLHGKRMQDLPIAPDAVLTSEEMDVTADYCLHSDLDATENLWRALKEPLQLRVALGKDYGQDFRSKSDSQIGEAIVKKRVEQLTGARPQKVDTRPGTTFKYPIPAFLRFETPVLQEVLDRLRETEFVVNDKGKVDLPAWLAGARIELGSSIYQMGIGGLHSTEAKRAVHADEGNRLKDFDVAAYYPSIILQSNLFPKALGKPFLDVYRKIRDERVEAKRKAKSLQKKVDALKKQRAEGPSGQLGSELARLEQEIVREKVKDSGGKIQINGVFGKLGSRYSILYAPHLLITVTLTGQLALLMLVERAERAGISVVSGNTDGVVFRCPEDKEDALTEIVRQWEAETAFELEETEYLSVYNSSVNSYFAIKADGGHKRKGPLANPWNKDKSDFDPRAQLMKNPQATICSDAALALIKHGTPIEETIHGCTDIRQFVTVIKADGGATWRGRYLGKTVRYYWSTDGEEIRKAKPNAKGTHPTVPKSEGAAPCMTLPDELPWDIDYERYIAETREILMDIGYAPRPPVVKRIRLTKANKGDVLSLWAAAA